MARAPSSLNLSPLAGDDGIPQLRTADVAASHRYPFHLRVHPDRWEINEAGRWELTLERSHLRPGVGGVQGREEDLASLRDTSLVSYWEGFGDRRTRLLKSRSQILTGIFPDGVFLDEVDVQVVENEKLRKGRITIAAWENIEGGLVVADALRREEAAKKIAMALWGLDGPTVACLAETRLRVSRLFSALQETAARRPTPSPAVLLRLSRVARLMDVLNGDKSASEMIASRYALPGSVRAVARIRSPLEIFMDGLRDLPEAEQAQRLQQWVALVQPAAQPVAPVAPPPAPPASEPPPPPPPAPVASDAAPTQAEAPPPAQPQLEQPKKPGRRSSPPKDPAAPGPAVGIDDLFT